jgi:hypothetical protein
MRFILAALLLVCGCSDGGTTTAKDMAGNSSICPNHPANCEGSCCGSVCTFTQVDVKNCGTCGNVCPAGEVCANGACGCAPMGAACTMGKTCCGGDGCADLMSDSMHCGSCTNKCSPGLMCVRGACVCGNAGVVCGAGQQCCSGTCMSTCTVAPPDMAVSGPTLPYCDCSGLMDFGGTHCPLSRMCVAHNCCFENTQGIPLLMSCSATPTLCTPGDF